MAERHPREAALRRVHGPGALFAAAYGNVGSSIYYALGLVALYALGLTPVTFVIAGIIFAFTAATYVEATVLYPEAGGSSSFARHAFNELASFLAGWAQMLTYIVTAAISAFFVPHYLAVFWEPLGEGPADVIFGIGLLACLALLNVRGTEESARLNLVLAVADLATQVVLVVIGLLLVLNPDLLVSQVDLGTAPTWGDFLLGIAVGMVAYTGIETISNMSEEARVAEQVDPPWHRRRGPRGGRDLRLPAGDRALGDAGHRGAGGRVHDRARDDLRGRPGARDRREHRPLGGAHRRPTRLRRGARRGDPADRDQRGADRALAADLLDGPASPAARDPAPGAPAVQDPVHRDHRLLRDRGAGDGPGRDRLPGHDLRLRGDALVHGRPRLGDQAAQAAAAGRAPARDGGRAAVAAAGQRPDPRGRGADDGGARRPRHLRRLRRRDGPRPGRARHRRRLDDRRDPPLRRLPALQGPAADDRRSRSRA